MIDQSMLIAILLAPLAGAVVAGLFGRWIGRAGAHWITILAVAASFVLSAWVLYRLMQPGVPVFNRNVYTWFAVGPIYANIGFLVDRLSALMMAVVTFVSLMVHVYTIGYMKDDDGYQRFFSYIALFTFSMLLLVMSNNFLQLFIGWELVGLVSYLLIGFWYTRPTATFAALKAFIVNRVGDFGFILGIAGALYWFGSLDYAQVFINAHTESVRAGIRTVEIFAGHPWSVATIVCVCLFVGAMGKSAQVPLHIWLPDSMEGPTPISALIHAATMVTAGIFMVARMSPLYELSEAALSFVLIIGATTALFTGLIGIVQNDIKRVIAYSTLSQLGYMTVALGASAYAAGIFHLMTHAFFKALLFLGAGSVIIAMHHEQDMRVMGGLRKYMPITWITMWIGSLALAGTPGFSGFFSKDSIIEAVGAADRYGAGYAYFCVLAGVFVTALYSFRLLYMTFHGKERFTVDPHASHDPHAHLPQGTLAHAPHESPLVVTLPLIALAIPSVIIGWPTVGPLLHDGWFGNAIRVAKEHAWMADFARDYHGAWAMFMHGFSQPTFWMALSGFLVATWVWLLNPPLAERARQLFGPVYTLLLKKYYADEILFALFGSGGVKLGRGLWRGGDVAVIDDGAVNGSAALVTGSSAVLRRAQTGYLYHYAFAMIVGLIVLLGALWWATRGLMP